jgi:Rhs element Vgr protein
MDAAAPRLRAVVFDLWLPRGPDLSWEVLSSRGTEALSQPYEFEIELWCDDPDAELEQALGADCELVLERNGLERRIYGVIAELEVLLAAELRIQRDGIGARVKVVPVFRLLEQEIDTRFFAGQTVIEILAALLGSRLAAYERTLDVESRIKATYNPRDYCVQFRESTFGFCSRIMEEEGIAYLFVPDDEQQRERMVLVDGNEDYASAELLVPGPIVVELDRPDELDRESLQAVHWRHKVATNRVVTRAHNYKLGNPIDEGEASDLGEPRPIVRAQILDGVQRQIIDDPLGDPEALAFDGSGLAQQVPLARRLLEAKRVDTALGRGRGNAIGFAPGSVFELEQALASGPRTKRFVLTRVVHGAVQGGGAYENQFECIARDQVFRPARKTPKPRVHGVQTGVVVGKVPDEVHTDRLGRVQVGFPVHGHGPASPQATSSPQATCWIRVAQIWAGQGFGAMVIPRVGMEVVVSFVDGDPDCPLITGCVYNGTNLPPYELPGELSKSTFKTNSTPGGEAFSEVRFEDAKGSEQMFVRAQRRMDLRVQGTMYSTCTGDREDIVGTEDPNGGNTNACLLTVFGDVNTFVHEQHLRHSTGTSTMTCNRDVLEANTGRRLTWVDEEYELNAPKIITEASETISQKANLITLAGSDTVSLMGGAKLVLESNNALELRVGNSFISLHQGGIDIEGFMLRLNSGGGVGHANDALSTTYFEAAFPFEALPADDGRIRAGGHGGGSRKRERRSWKLEPHSAPPMKPAELRKPEDSITPADVGGTWVRVEWTQAEVWCSEAASLSIVVEGVRLGAHESAFILDAVDGGVVSGLGVNASGDRFEVPVSLCDILPRRLPPGVEESRELNARLSNGLFTLKSIALRFLSNLPLYTRETRFAEFSISVRDHGVEISSQIRYKRGMMGWIISLGDLADERAEGLIGGNIDGTTDWRYCKKVTISGDPSRLSYWDGQGWRIVPAEFQYANALGNKLIGIGLWRGPNGEVETQMGKLPWPDPLPDWAPQSTQSLEQAKPRWSTAIGGFWSGKFDLERDQCRGHDPQCCRHPIECKVGFSEVEERTRGVVVIGENHARANSGAWPRTETDKTVIHEFGHHLGNPDEYPGASTVDVWVNGDGAVLGIDKQSIMGSGTTPRRRHFETIAEALAELVERETGKTYTFTPVAVR